MIKDAILKNIQEQLTDMIDEYFPKIKPNGKNEGRGEAIVIVGIALSRFRDAFDELERETREDERERVKDIIMGGDIPETWEGVKKYIEVTGLLNLLSPSSEKLPKEKHE